MKGVEGEALGEGGLSGHGAAGFELDRADFGVGTPTHALILASSADRLAPPAILVPEEMLTHLTTLAGPPPEALTRADLVFFEAAGGGAVFATGSITFLGSIFTDSIGALMRNLIRRFLDPAPFPPPPDNELL